MDITRTRHEAACAFLRVRAFAGQLFRKVDFFPRFL